MTSLEHALALVEREDWALAERHLRPIVSAQPESADAAYLLGLSCWHLGMRDDAERYLTETHRLAPSYAPSCFYLAAVCVARGELGAGSDWLEKFVALSPADPNGWYRLGKTLFAQARYVEAVPKLERAWALAPGSNEIRHLLGCALFNCTRFAQAIETLVPLARDGGAKAPELLRLLCRAAEEIDDYARAADFATRLSTISPDDTEDCLLLARTRFASGDVGGGSPHITDI